MSETFDRGWLPSKVAAGLDHLGDAVFGQARYNADICCVTEVSGVIRILLVDDQPLVRQGVRMRLGLESDFEIIGEADDGASAIEAVHLLGPDVVLMDVEMPRMDGLTATKAICAIAPQCRVIVVSLHSDAPTRTQALAAGAAAFVSKHDGEEALIETIRRAVRLLD